MNCRLLINFRKFIDQECRPNTQFSINHPESVIPQSPSFTFNRQPWTGHRTEDYAKSHNPTVHHSQTPTTRISRPSWNRNEFPLLCIKRQTTFAENKQFQPQPLPPQTTNHTFDHPRNPTLCLINAFPSHFIPTYAPAIHTIFPRATSEYLRPIILTPSRFLCNSCDSWGKNFLLLLPSHAPTQAQMKTTDQYTHAKLWLTFHFDWQSAWFD